MKLLELLRHHRSWCVHHQVLRLLVHREDDDQKAEDLMMQAPSPVSEKQLKELHIRLAPQAMDNKG